MSKAHKPTVFNGEPDGFYDANYEINNKMKIPKNLRVGDEYTNDDDTSNTNKLIWNEAIPNDTFDMHMPDRILVVGHDQHVGLKAPPLEMTLDNPNSSPEHTMTRVQTPPVILTLEDFFPTFEDENSESEYPNAVDLNQSLPVSTKPYINESQIVRRAVREQTPVWTSNLDVSLAPTEEIQHLRRQVGKLNRRVMAVELEMIQRQQRDKIFYAITIAYFFFKAFNWLTRN